jgi:hypothetical protein
MTSLNTSPWIPDGPPRKRESTIRRPVTQDVSTSDIPESVAETETRNAVTTSKVAQLISKLADNNDGNKLADYVPNTRPEITVNKVDVKEYGREREKEKEKEKEKEPTPPPTKFLANDINLANLSNYNQTYSSQPMFQNNKPYYANMGIGSDNSKLAEKINYMIHLLEEQQMEKTANVTEEFILYILLGVFVIFTVDSFTRAGKYVR